MKHVTYRIVTDGTVFCVEAKKLFGWESTFPQFLSEHSAIKWAKEEYGSNGKRHRVWRTV